MEIIFLLAPLAFGLAIVHLAGRIACGPAQPEPNRDRTRSYNGLSPDTIRRRLG